MISSDKRKIFVKVFTSCMVVMMMLSLLASCSIGNMHISFGDTAATEADTAAAAAAVDKNDAQLYYGTWRCPDTEKVFTIVPGGVGKYYNIGQVGNDSNAFTDFEKEIAYEVKDGALSVTYRDNGTSETYSASFVLDDSGTQLEMVYDEMVEYKYERIYNPFDKQYTDSWKHEHAGGKDVGCIFVKSEN